MRCDDCREALSALLDGEAPARPLTVELVDAHVARCMGCRSWSAAATALHRQQRVRPAEPVPDLSAPILAAARPVRPRRVQAGTGDVREGVRYVLLAMAITQLVLALPPLLLGEDAGASVHVARELGSFDIALAVGLLWAAWQPHRASGLLPMAAALAGAVGVTAVLDLAQGEAPLGGEAHHVLDLAGVACLWLLTRPATHRPTARVATP